MKKILKLPKVRKKKDSRQERRRSFFLSKSVEPGASEGIFIIEVRVENIGNIELRNIIIKDIFPVSFNLTKFTLSEAATHEIAQIGDQTELSVNVAEIKPNSSFIINYDLSGLGNYQKSEPVVIILDKDKESP
ncbi:MAG: hypothetical protein ACFE8B_11685 [Candidatus Hermodarchaeota archaeon]